MRSTPTQQTSPRSDVSGIGPGTTLGPNLRAFVIYLRSVQGILARLCCVLRDLFGLDISEGALVNILDASRAPFATQTSLIKARLLSPARSWLRTRLG